MRRRGVQPAAEEAQHWDSPSPATWDSPEQAHRKAILAEFEAAGARVTECQTLRRYALDLVAEVERELERAQGRAEAAKRLLRRVAEGHI